jgi:hypothetical protein
MRRDSNLSGTTRYHLRATSSHPTTTSQRRYYFQPWNSQTCSRGRVKCLLRLLLGASLREEFARCSCAQVAFTLTATKHLAGTSRGEGVEAKPTAGDLVLPTHRRHSRQRQAHVHSSQFHVREDPRVLSELEWLKVWARSSERGVDYLGQLFAFSMRS